MYKALGSIPNNLPLPPKYSNKPNPKSGKLNIIVLKTNSVLRQPVLGTLEAQHEIWIFPSPSPPSLHPPFPLSFLCNTECSALQTLSLGAALYKVLSTRASLETGSGAARLSVLSSGGGSEALLSLSTILIPCGCGVLDRGCALNSS